MASSDVAGHVVGRSLVYKVAGGRVCSFPSSFLTRPLVFYLEYNVCLSLPLVLTPTLTIDLVLVLVLTVAASQLSSRSTSLSSLSSSVSVLVPRFRPPSFLLLRSCPSPRSVGSCSPALVPVSRLCRFLSSPSLPVFSFGSRKIPLLHPAARSAPSVLLMCCTIRSRRPDRSHRGGGSHRFGEVPTLKR
jgi:hypothetical protein